MGFKTKSELLTVVKHSKWNFLLYGIYKMFSKIIHIQIKDFPITQSSKSRAETSNFTGHNDKALIPPAPTLW